MPVIKSAKKRVKVTAKATARNARVKRQMRDALKRFSAALSSGKSAEIAKTQRVAASALDVAAKKNVIHANKASRKKAQLAKRAKDAGVKPADLKSDEPKKAPVKKPAAKKVPTKKPAAKTPAKAPAKKR